MSLSRRGFIKTLSSGAVATTLIGCGSDDTPDGSTASIAFNHGVASGDPTAEAVILWTRLTTDARQLTVQWEVATDRGFSQIIRAGETLTDMSRDFTVKIDADQLAPATHYFYRFRSQDTVSPVGETKTLATGHLEQAALAVVSCANYPAGYFHAYREILNQHQQAPLDAVLHLGDYIYEYGTGGYATEDAEALGRLPSGGTECLTMNDYRARYAQYRSDPDLQAMHAALPMIAVWDDHEIANDTWRDGAENHQLDEGVFAERRAAAAAAWLEWMPVRENPASSVIIYRDFRFGDLLDLYMLDTRVVARDQPLDYFALESFTPDAITGLLMQARAADRQLLGTDQKQWLLNQMASHSGKWSLLGQQILMAKMELPSTVMTALLAMYQAPADSKPAAMQALNQAIQAYLTDPASDPLLLPYNLDAWDGFYMEREWLYSVAQQLGKQLVCLAGDTHNAWCSELKNHSGDTVGVEFATHSVSSPGMETYLGLDDAVINQMELMLPNLVTALQWTNLKQRGFMRLDIRHDAINTTWHFLSDIKAKTYSVTTHHATTKNALTIS
ncbi:alkaline phosphatase D family protein [Photobacterium ganghwense]|uniref:alkaline phosphatase D family protein n=1 Tax=Photobacterium ganghwense TaxID=320778 RepID=UPI001A8E857F|nr:alkaline phosphatase D family protein [Photobacterium ganghwense]QSV14151.1 alkaline phosphatase D family protein [Photobacterium ganghwense]